MITPIDIKKNKAAMTPCYTAPELFSDDGSYNFKTDLWALGCIMYEMAVGQVPFFDENVRSLINKIIYEDVNFNRRELQNFSDEFIDILRKLLEKDPSSRISWGDIERHAFWELNVVETADEMKPSTARVKSAKPTLEKKKSVDVLRLSRNALKNMMDERDDEYARKENTKKEVDNADQEFKFEANEKNEDYDSEKTYNILI
jgi:serine/threonine protein kinase